MTSSNQPTQPVNFSLPDDDFWANIAHKVSDQPSPRGGLYADWTASGLTFEPIEKRLAEQVLPYMANTHTEDSFTGRTMSRWLHEANQVIKRHVNASDDDVLLNEGQGMTGALAKLVRLLGWSCHEQHREFLLAKMATRPLIYVTHREHHSNHTLWLESLADVKIIPALEGDEVDLEWLKADLQRESARPIKVASVIASSNVTGVETPYREIAKLMHREGGWCFVDFAASAPYVDIDMHPACDEWLDAIFFSPHKFLGGPGSSGVLVFNKALYRNRIPDTPGGGTVTWTNPWGEHEYVEDIEQRESGGTPAILQTLRTAYAIQLKDEMGTDRIWAREQALNAYFFERLKMISGVNVLSDQHKARLSIFSIVFDQCDYRAAVRELSDAYGVETRGGCACAGSYGHYLLGIDRTTSAEIAAQIDQGNEAVKPGWVRVSLHPTMTLADVDRIADAIECVSIRQSPPAAYEAKTPSVWASLLS